MAGIDYGMGTTNIDKENGIRYGVIPQNEVLQVWCDSSEAYYGEPEECTCMNPECGEDNSIPIGKIIFDCLMFNTLYKGFYFLFIYSFTYSCHLITHKCNSWLDK